MQPFDDLALIDKLLTTTKAVRRRLDLDRPVDREVITECIRLAGYAPNASNAQVTRPAPASPARSSTWPAWVRC
jgi:nitroreductase